VVGTYDLIVAGLSVLVSLSTVVVCLRQRVFVRHLFVNLYLISSLAFTLGSLYVIRTEGYSSQVYFYFYYTADAIQNVIGYLLIGGFFAYLFRESVFRPYVGPTLGLFFLGVAGISGLFVSKHVGQPYFYSRFANEFQQNMFFVGVLLTFLLWISMTYLRSESRRFVLLLSGLGIYFSAHAVNYALQFLLKSDAATAALTKVPPIAYTVMVSLWLYTFLRVPEGEAAYVPQEGTAAKKPVYVVASAGRGQH
jgi:hypothetical protein